MGYSSTGDGKPQYTSPTAKREMAAQLIQNGNLRKIAELAGRMRRIAAEKQRTKTKHGVDELANIMVGDDLSRLIPSELAKLAHPILKADFYKKYLEKQLLQYKLRGREKLSFGSAILCVDESSSMQGNRDIWAKASMLALLQIAQQQKRIFSVVHFDDKVTRVDTFDKVNVVDIINSVLYFSGGGTDFIHPLNCAIDIIKNNTKHNKSDIIIITDGNSTLSQEYITILLEQKKKLNINIISIVIGTNTDTLSQISDKVVLLDDIIGDDEALSAMFSI
jgi:uncharacterized protein with von Willebrand factor type A (vWA) domain